MTWTIFRWEFRLLTRGAPFWLAALTSAAIGVHIARQEPDSPFLVAFALAGWALPVIPILFLPVLGAVRRRDEAAGIQELILSRPVGAQAYVMGKFLAGWAALALAWLISQGACSAFLLQWPTFMGMSALLLLPTFAFLTALCLAADVLTGRTVAVLAVGTAFVMGAWLYHPGYWASYLLPGFLPHWVSEVYGFAPYTSLMLGNKAWALALTLALLAASLWLLPRRTPFLAGILARRLTAALGLAAILGGGTAIAAMWPAPRPAGWNDVARDWEHEQVRIALADGSRYWQRYGDIYLPPYHAHYAGHMQATLEEARPYFPDLGDAVLVEGSYVNEPELEGRAVILTHGMAGDGASARRSVVRAMAVAQWSQSEATRPPSQPVEAQLGYPTPPGTTLAPALYHQWVVLEQVEGPEAVAKEQQLFRDAFSPDRERSSNAFDTLRRTRAVGMSVWSGASGPALVLWDVGQRVGHDRVLAALVEAWSSRPVSEPWDDVSRILGTDLAAEPGWPPKWVLNP